ncbi:class I SAM-dependent methyltransferase [Mycolicibacterium frederiksbergense]|nr:class I SAM-dependent methyltransferase [Mycolicibacterium frederiksbergense]
MYGAAESFTYAECATCGSLTLLEPPADFSSFYPPDYLAGAPTPAELGFAARTAITALSRSLIGGRGAVGALGRYAPVRRIRSLTAILDAVARVPGRRPRRILDVGCGSGLIPFAVSRANDVEVLGIDPFAVSNDRLDEKVEVRKASLDDVDSDFDVIMFNHSLEHVLDPIEALGKAADRLAAGGTVILRLPTVSSHVWREYRTHWIAIDPPRHTWIPSRQGLHALASRVGLEIVSNYDDSSEAQFWSAEQARQGIALMDPDSHYVDPRRSNFTVRELVGFWRRSQQLNRALDGDQTVVYLQPSG